MSARGTDLMPADPRLLSRKGKVSPPGTVEWRPRQSPQLVNQDGAALPRVSLLRRLGGATPALTFLASQSGRSGPSCTRGMQWSERHVLNSLRRAMRMVAPHRRWTHQDARVAPWHTLTPPHVFAILEKLRARRYSESSIRGTWYSLRGVLRAAWRMGLYSDRDIREIDGTVLRTTDRPIGRRAPRSVVFDVDAVLALPLCASTTPQGLRNGLFVRLTKELHLTRTEIAQLTLDDYRLDTRFTASTDRLLRVAKRFDEDIVELPHDLTAWIDRWLLVRGTWPGPLLCPITPKGLAVHRPMTSRSLFRLTWTLANAAGLQRPRRTS